MSVHNLHSSHNTLWFVVAIYLAVKEANPIDLTLK